MRRWVVSASTAVVLGLGGAVAVAQPASASGGCSGDIILVNSGAGAEAPSWRYGHAHLTGRHYIRAIVRYSNRSLVQWWADNDGGLDGDTWDTPYQETLCA
jgi:hypothetical protein